MFVQRVTQLALALVLVFNATAWGLPKTADNAATSESGKIPISTQSSEARNEYLQGRDLSERLQAQQSLQHFEKAVALDPDFATAELALANNAPTAKDFFEHMKKAVTLADKTSTGEKLFILSTEAGTNGDVVKQKKLLDQLIAAYPNDERAQFNLCNFYFGQQEFEHALESCQKAAALAPGYSPPYNTLGYVQRQLEDYAGAERSFQKYIELIPSDPNPYDSYAELLLTTGKFDQSISQYRKALSLDSHFASSRFGIASDLLYEGKPDEAARELQEMADKADNDGQLRTAYFGMCVVAADRGRLEQAIQAMNKEYAVAEKMDDVASMAADMQAKGNIYLQMQHYDAATQQFEGSLRMIEGSSLNQDIKDNAKLLNQYNQTAVAIGRKDYKTAKNTAEEFRRGAEQTQNPLQVNLAHELLGRIALAQKDYATAVTELNQANLQNPMNLYRLGLAHRGKGDDAEATRYEAKLAHFNPLLQLNYAFARTKAQKKAPGA